MRLWHKDLIPFLPKKQLTGQWRECCLIAKNIKEKGTPNHILVNKVTLFPEEHFGRYCGKIYTAMLHSGCACRKQAVTRHLSDKALKAFDNPLSVSDDELFYTWHNDRYFWQCYYNLQEKYDCDGISVKDWLEIFNATNNSLKHKT